MAMPDMVVDTEFFKVNLTIVISITIFCLTAMGTIIKCFPRKELKEDEKPGNTPSCKQRHEAIDENKTHVEELRSDISEMKTQLATMRVELDNSSKNVEELKSKYKALTNKLDDFLKQLLEMLN